MKVYPLLTLIPSIRYKTLNPTWNETIEFPVYSKNNVYIDLFGQNVITRNLSLLDILKALYVAIKVAFL